MRSERTTYLLVSIAMGAALYTLVRYLEALSIGYAAPDSLSGSIRKYFILIGVISCGCIGGLSGAISLYRSHRLGAINAIFYGSTIGLLTGGIPGAIIGWGLSALDFTYKDITIQNLAIIVCIAVIRGLVAGITALRFCLIISSKVLMHDRLRSS